VRFTNCFPETPISTPFVFKLRFGLLAVVAALRRSVGDLAAGRDEAVNACRSIQYCRLKERA
jgi:hypothetical protein